MENMPRVSIIIPCYNHGQYIMDAIESIEKIEDKSLYEIIIVNDGSTDEGTNNELKRLEGIGYNVIFQKNMGLCASRNNAISISNGEFILPLDADNKIRPEYIYKGIKILDNKKEIGVCYGNCEYFGEQTGVFKPGEFNLQKLMVTNFIDACAIFRKDVWVAAGGFDPNVNALGDWDIWLSTAFNGFKFYYIDEVLFDYRILSNSMIRSFNSGKTKSNKNIEYLIKKHKYYFGPEYIDEDIMKKFSKSPLGFIGKLLLKKYFPIKFEKMVEQGKLRKYI